MATVDRTTGAELSDGYFRKARYNAGVRPTTPEDVAPCKRSADIKLPRNAAGGLKITGLHALTRKVLGASVTPAWLKGYTGSLQTSSGQQANLAQRCAEQHVTGQCGCRVA